MRLNSFGTGKPLVFFHGWGFDHTIWFELQESLKTSFRLILVDLPGFGSSPLIPWESFQARLLEALPEQFALLGWSLGGLFATRLAFEAPLRVTKLINVASTPCFIRKKGWPGLSPQVFVEFTKKLEIDPKQCLHDFRGLFCDLPETTSYQLAGLQMGLKVLETWDLRAMLADLACPIAYIFGAKDPIVPKSLQKTMQKQYDFCEYTVLEDASHAPFLSHKEAFMEALRL